MVGGTGVVVIHVRLSTPIKRQTGKLKKLGKKVTQDITLVDVVFVIISCTEIKQ
jgi:hypothetical protein